MNVSDLDLTLLLQNHFADLETFWQDYPDNGTLALALTIKEFMSVHQIQSVTEGISRFTAFKNDQRDLLVKLGFDAEPANAASPSFVIQPA